MDSMDHVGGDRGDGDAQPLAGYRTNPEWEDLVAQTGAMIAALDEIADDAERHAVFAALAGIDAIHREALHRLVRLFKEGVLEQVVTDPAIRTLMGMYDLLPESEPACQKVWDFVQDDTNGPSETDQGIAAGPLEEPPHWSPAPLTRPLGDGEAFVCRMEEGAYIVARVDGRHYALQAHCEVHDGLMHQGRLENVSWICPHGPGCVYDIRNGARLGGGTSLDCLPTRIDDAGRILLGFGVPFEPEMPAF